MTERGDSPDPLVGNRLQSENCKTRQRLLELLDEMTATMAARQLD